MHPSNGQFSKGRHACWPIQCRKNPIWPRIDLTAEMNRAYSMIQSRHNGSVTPKSFTSIQGMRVRNHCFILSHEVMGILMLMALGSRQWYCISSCNYSNSRFFFSSHATTTTRTTSLKRVCTVERIHCKVKKLVWLKMIGYGLMIPGSDVVGLEGEQIETHSFGLGTSFRNISQMNSN